MSNIIVWAIVIVCVLNVIRMTAYIVSSDFYLLKHRQKNHRSRYTPTISVVIPAHNEELTIQRALSSVYESDYPARKLQIIVANDGSTDATRKIVTKYMRTHADREIVLLNRVNRGKAAVLNYAIEHVATGKLIMCLDSDSYLEPQSLKNAVDHFRDRDIVALSSNVNIKEDGSLLALIQRFEYIVCYQMKKGQALLGLEYIVGGIGSMFRKSVLRKVGYYDTNTMTEDIDLTMKIINTKTKRQKVAYAADSIVHTEAAHSLRELRTQRFRWKFGRSQTFLKNKNIFFSIDSRHSKRLSWFMLPFSLIQDLLFFIEPLVVAYLLYITLMYFDFSIFINALIVISVYLIINIFSSGHLSLKQQLRLIVLAPSMYVLMYVLSYAEYFALIKSLLLTPKLKHSIQKKHQTWKSPQRKAAAA